MGRYRKPPQQAILEGAPGKRSIPVGSIPDTDVGNPPRGLSAEAKRVWNRLRQEWSLILSSADREAFAFYCRAAARQDALEDRCDREGMFDFDKDGRNIVSANFRAMQANGATLMKLFAMFGVTPGTRGRVPTRTVTPNAARRGGLEILQGGKADHK